jgi:Casein kinase II regulatory subunit
MVVQENRFTVSSLVVSMRHGIVRAFSRPPLLPHFIFHHAWYLDAMFCFVLILSQQGMKDEETCSVSRMICLLSHYFAILGATIVVSVNASAYSEIEYGSGFSDYRNLLPYLSDDQELLKSFYISDDEQEKRILNALDKIPFDRSETECESQDSASSSAFQDDDVKQSMARPHQLLLLPASQSIYLSSRRNFSLSSYQILCISPFTSAFSMSFASTAPAKQLSVRQAAFDGLISPWVHRFLSGCRRDMLLPIPRDFCADNFNLILLPPIIEWIGRETNSSIKNIAKNDTLIYQQKRYPTFRQALKLLTQNGPIPCNIPGNLERATTVLYLLLHQRYILSPRGLNVIRRRFLSGSVTSSPQNSRQTSDPTTFNNVDPIFGRCPNLSCRGTPLLPIGDSDSFTISSMPRFGASSSSNAKSDIDAANFRAMRFCAACRQVFYHWDSEVDGCAWGTSFCHLFLMVFGKEVFGDWNYVHSLSFLEHSRNNKFVGRISGFRIHPSVYELRS